jgi:hypothetical protein
MLDSVVLDDDVHYLRSTDSILRVRDRIIPPVNHSQKNMLEARRARIFSHTLLVMLQSGMDASTLAEVFNFYAYPQLVSFFGSEDFNSWDTFKCPVRIDLRRPKSDYRYYSFLDVDAIEAVKD